jgi:8-oxo-dGTP diphosphatase
MKERFKLIASIYLILIDNGKVLLLRRFNTGYEDGNYSLPAGHLDDNESLRDGLRREVREEIGIGVDTNVLKLVHVMHRREADIRIDFFYTTEAYTGKPFNAEPDRCDEVGWYPLDKLPENTIPYIRQAIEGYKSDSLYSERGWK